MPTLTEVTEAEGARDEAIARAKRLRAQLQLDCEHTHTIESVYDNRPHCVDAEFRVCLDCGLAERGWNCGFQILRRPPQRENVPRDEAHKLRVGPVHPNPQFVGYYQDVVTMGGQAAYRRAKLAEVLGIGPKVPDTRPSESIWNQ
jgi:hypothetical protein